MTLGDSLHRYLVWALWALLAIAAIGLLHFRMTLHVETLEAECMQRCHSRGLKHEYTPPHGYRYLHKERCECRK